MSAETLRRELVDELLSVSGMLNRWLDSKVREHGLTHARVRLLNALEHAGPLRMSEVGSGLGVTPRNVTALVDSLEADGLVARRPDPDDRRATLLELTPDGETACMHTLRTQHDAIAEIYGELSDGDQRELLRILGALRGILERRGA